MSEQNFNLVAADFRRASSVMISDHQRSSAPWAIAFFIFVSFKKVLSVDNISIQVPLSLTTFHRIKGVHHRLRIDIGSMTTDHHLRDGQKNREGEMQSWFVYMILCLPQSAR